MRALKEGKFIVVNHVSETEETTSSYELAESLLFNLSKNQFTWSGSPQISSLSCFASLVSHHPTFCRRPAMEHAQCGKLQT